MSGVWAIIIPALAVVGGAPSKGSPGWQDSSMRINKYHIQVLLIEAIAAALVCCTIFVIAWVRTLSQPSRAQAFLNDFTKLEVGKSTFEKAESLAQKHGGQVEPGSGPCTYEACVFRFVFENKPLTSTHLVPYIGLIGTIVVKDGVVARRYINYFRHAKRPFAYNVMEALLPPSDTPEGRGMRMMIGLSRMNVDPEGIPSAVSISMESPSSADQRRRAYALDVSCLSRLFGCGGPSAIFPQDIPYHGVPFQTHTDAW